MLFQRDKDLGWIIVFSAFLGFLLLSIVAAVVQISPKGQPYPVTLANSNFEKHFFRNVCQFMKYTALGAMALGIYGIIAWPPGPGSPRF